MGDGVTGDGVTGDLHFRKRYLRRLACRRGCRFGPLLQRPRRLSRLRGGLIS